MPTITILGSLNVDMVTITSRIPEGGETIQAKSFETGWGGKGANQAVAAARLSRSKCSSSDTKVRMVGAVGNDVFGPQMLKSMESDGIDVSSVRQLDGQKTGTAVILVEEVTGQNRILFTPGANFSLSVSDELVRKGEFGDVAIFQLETPMDVVMHNVELARAGGTRVILNPAPAQELPEDIYENLTYLIMNETEAAILSGRPPKSVSLSSDLDSVAADFIKKGVVNVIITLGADGVFYRKNTSLREGKLGERVPAIKTKVVDTTAAGDTFLGAFAVEIANTVTGKEDEVFDNAIAFAIRASSKTIEKAGAQSSIPWRNEVA